MGGVQPIVPGGLLRDAALMLGVALVFVTIFRRLGLGATLGYIVAGALIGPSVLGLFQEPEAIQRVSEIGIALLLFIVGLELQPSRLWRLRKDIFGLGLLQVTLCGLATDFCVYFSAIDAREAGFEAAVVLEASRAIDVDGSLARALAAMRQAGVEFVAAD